MDYNNDLSVQFKLLTRPKQTIKLYFLIACFGLINKLNWNNFKVIILSCNNY